MLTAQSGCGDHVIQGLGATLSSAGLFVPESKGLRSKGELGTRGSFWAWACLQMAVFQWHIFVHSGRSPFCIMVYS